MSVVWHRKHKRDSDPFSIYRKQTKHQQVDDDDLDEDVDDYQATTPVAKFKKLFSFDKHRQIERKFTTMVTVLCFLIVGMVVGLVHAHHESVLEENEVTNVSDNVGFSKANATFKIQKLWTTPNRSLVVIPLVFNQQNLSTIQWNATKYALQMGSMSKYLASDPKAQLVMFSNTSQAAIVMQNVTRFPSQVVFLTLDERKSLVQNGNSSFSGGSDNTSHGRQLEAWVQSYGKKHNVTYFKVNPGASNINVFQKDLSYKQLNLSDLYNDLYGKKEKQQIESNIAKTQNDLTYLYRQMQSYENNIKMEGYKLTYQPPWVPDNWRPANAVDPKTGAQKQANPNVQANQTNYPQDLPRLDGHGSMQSDETAAQNDNGAPNQNNNQTPNANTNSQQFGVGGQAQQASQNLSNLCNVWTSIYNDKMLLYVTYPQQLWSLQQTVQQQQTNATVSRPSAFQIISPVRLND